MCTEPLYHEWIYVISIPEKDKAVLDINRTSVYYKGTPISQDELDCKSIIDRLHTDNPACGARQLSAQLKKRGYQVGRRKTRRYRPSKREFCSKFFQHIRKAYLSQSRRLPPLQAVSNSKFVSVGVQSPTEINAPRGCAVILIGICQLR